VLSVIEAIMENPGAILHAQVNVLKTRRMAELKAQGVEYEQRIEELEKIEYPKPEVDFIYDTFNLFAKHHPWVVGNNIAPKSIARDMHEQVLSFHDYIKEYGLARSEGVLLRYLTDVYRALRQTVPEKVKTEDLLDLEEWLGAEVRQVDASLLDEWERLEAAGGAPRDLTLPKEPEAPPDITTNPRAFLVMLRNACFRLVRAMASRDAQRFAVVLAEFAPDEAETGLDREGQPWLPARVEQLFEPYFLEHELLLVDADARSASRLVIDRADPEHWLVRQTLSDPEEHHDWSLVFDLDLGRSRAAGHLVLSLAALENA
jgi:hypothetical protein